MPGPQPCHCIPFIFCIVGRGLDPSGGVGDAAPYILGRELSANRRGELPPSLAPLVRNPFTAVRRGRACPARSLAVVSPLTVCIVGRGLDPSAAFRPTIVTGSSVGEGFIPPGAFAFPLASGPLPPTLSQLYHTLFPTPLQGVVKISLQIFLSFCVIIEKV